jgi:uncharacterized protein (TIGR02452 family)
MYSKKSENIKIFNDTLAQISKDRKLQEAVEHSFKNQVFYADKTSAEYFKYGRKQTFDNPAKITVCKEGSFNTARKYNGSVAVLNFASATNPGGGVTKGSSAQEECLCRCSTLYQCLNTDWAKELFYTPHKTNGTPLHNDDIIYTPDVVILKSDNYTNLYQTKKVNVITCAAPNLRETPANAYNHENGEGVKISNAELQKLHEERAYKILSCAAFHGNETVVLGAFGCGAFRNPPEVVANAYKKVISEHFMNSFKNIVFAVYCSSEDTTNYDTFKKVFEVC